MIEWILLAIIALLQIVDAASTRAILKLGGRELNPVMRWLMARLGTTPSLLVTKCMMIGACAVAAYSAESVPTLKVLLYFVLVVYLYVTMNNLQVWKNLNR